MLTSVRVIHDERGKNDVEADNLARAATFYL
jgi:hypothetical protein